MCVPFGPSLVVTVGVMPSIPSLPAAPVSPFSPRAPVSPFAPSVTVNSPVFLSPVVIVTMCVPFGPSLVVTVGVMPSIPSLPAAPSAPLSPLGPLMLPAFSHVSLFLTKTSPVSVLTYLSPSLP